MKREHGSLPLLLVLVVALLGAAGPPASAAEVKQFGVGTDLSCALTKAGKATCWGGDPSYDIDEVPEGRLESLSVGTFHACGLRRSGRAACWGNSELNATRAPGRWKKIEAGYYGTCGIRPSGEIDCYGYKPTEDRVPRGRFRSVSMGGDFACGLRRGGGVECWGNNDRDQTAAPGGEFKSLTTGAYSACAQKRSGRLTCWGSDLYGLVSQLDGRIAGQTRVGSENYCALPKGGGALVCGGERSRPVADPPPGRYIGVDHYAFSDHACAMRHDRTLTCWGGNGFGQTDVPRAFLPTER